MKLRWEEPKDCATPLGWLHWEDHPDVAEHGDYASTCVANYLDYRSLATASGTQVHAVAYIFEVGPQGTAARTLGSAEFATIAEAKEWAEATVARATGNLTLFDGAAQ